MSRLRQDERFPQFIYTVYMYRLQCTAERHEFLHGIDGVLLFFFDDLGQGLEMRGLSCL